MIKFAHFNFNVLDIEKSIQFYQDTIGLEVSSEINNENFRIVYLKDKETSFLLELTQIFGRTEPYDLGECEFHLAFVSDQYGEFYEKHKQMGCICFENKEMGIYFIEDPDGYWVEIVPDRSKV